MVSGDGHCDITHQLKELNERISDITLQFDRMCSILSILIELFDKTKERLPVDDGLAEKEQELIVKDVYEVGDIVLLVDDHGNKNHITRCEIKHVYADFDYANAKYGDVRGYSVEYIDYNGDVSRMLISPWNIMGAVKK